MALIIDRLSALNIVAHLTGVLVPCLHDFEHNRVALKALIISFVVWDSEMARVLQNADYVRVTRVLVNSIEGSMTHSFILAANVRFVHTDFYLLHRVFRKVGQRYVRPVEEFRQHVLVHLLLVLVVRLDVHYLHIV